MFLGEQWCNACHRGNHRSCRWAGDGVPALRREAYSLRHNTLSMPMSGSLTARPVAANAVGDVGARRVSLMGLLCAISRSGRGTRSESVDRDQSARPARRQLVRRLRRKGSCSAGGR
jgi:hypothetical protein